jgi:hypothetical protein
MREYCIHEPHKVLIKGGVVFADGVARLESFTPVGAVPVKWRPYPAGSVCSVKVEIVRRDGTRQFRCADMPRPVESNGESRTQQQGFAFETDVPVAENVAAIRVIYNGEVLEEFVRPAAGSKFDVRAEVGGAIAVNVSGGRGDFSYFFSEGLLTVGMHGAKPKGADTPCWHLLDLDVYSSADRMQLADLFEVREFAIGESHAPMTGTCIEKVDRTQPQ